MSVWLKLGMTVKRILINLIFPKHLNSYALSLALLCCILHASPSRAGIEHIENWRPWIEAKHPQLRCAYHGTNLEERVCAWPEILKLQLSDEGGKFSQSWQIDGTAEIQLPGDAKHWPLNVLVNGEAAKVTQKNGRPSLSLKKGTYTVSGSFLWKKVPQRLQLPAKTGLTRLTIYGKTLSQPHIEANGMVWLQKKQETQKSERNSAKVEVFRALIDGVPMRVLTTLKISVSGDARELTTGTLLLPKTTTESFDSPLPAKINSDGALRIQVRSGQWQVHHSARISGNIKQFSTASDGGLWPEQEVWGFKSAPEIRQVRIVGPPLLDSTQIDLTENIRNLPLYLMNNQASLQLQQQNISQQQQSNKLSLKRTIWLDFYTKGATIRDNITGNIYRGSRLNALAPLNLGNVKIAGKPQVITKLHNDSDPGIEIRDDYVQLEALSHIDDRNQIKAGNWDTDFDTISTQLMLPPGWRVWHIDGPDTVRTSWVSNWTLWDIFLCLIIVGAIYKLMGVFWAAITFFAGVLTFHSYSSVFVYLFPFIILIPLLRTLPVGKARRTISIVCSVFIIIAGLNLVQFTIQQLRTAIYPQLEYSGDIVNSYASTTKANGTSTKTDMETRERNLSDEVFEADIKMQTKENMTESLSRMSSVSLEDYEGSSKDAPRLNTNEKVQTGPALPIWRWRTVNYSWTGPIKKQDDATLYLTGPTLSRLLNIVEVILSIALFLGISIAAVRKMTFTKVNNGVNVSTPIVGIIVSALFSVFSMSPSSVEAQDFPPEHLLKDYESRLIEKPDCAPQCFAVNKMHASIEDDVLEIQIEVSNHAHLSFALPVSKQWQPSSIRVNGKIKNNAKKMGRFYYLPLQAGAHSIRLRGETIGSKISLEFATDIYNARVSLDGWHANGIVDSALVGRALSFERNKKTAAVNSLVPDTAAAFVTVERQLTFGIDWFIHTSITRNAPKQGPISLAIPLLPGENVLSEGAQIVDNTMTVNLGSRESYSSWRSKMEPVDELHLVSPATNAWTETWTINASERWHIEYSGIEPINQSNSKLSNKTWKPWPKEELLLKISKPEAIAGAAHTVQSVKMHLKPGKRVATVSSRIAVTSSTGGDYTLKLPDNATTKTFIVNGDNYASGNDQQTLLASLKPGSNNIRIEWQLEKAISTLTTTPALDLQTPANNISMVVELPRDRWPLFVTGPNVGPAMLFWGMLCFILILAGILGYVIRRWQLSIPLKTWHWVLLGLGLSTINTYAGFFAIAWFASVEARKHYANSIQDKYFNAVQVGIAILTVIALCALLLTIPLSLLSSPNMHITGNGSSAFYLKWYADHAETALPKASIISVSIWYFRLAMLLWSIWLVFALMHWAKWGWAAYSYKQLWISTKKRE